MMKQSFALPPRRSIPLLVFFFSLLFSTVSFGQSPCPPEAGKITSNPGFPGCLPPGSGAFRVILVLDESGSIGTKPAGFEDEVETAVKGFAATLKSGVSGPNEMQMGIVEFATNASFVFPFKDVNDGNFESAVANYLNTGYVPTGASTNFQAALSTVEGIPNVDMVFFITDGDPNTGGGLNVWQATANRIKCAGTYIFGIGVTNKVKPNNIKALSGLDELNNPKSLQDGADYAISTFTNLADDLIDLANAQIDRQRPQITCSANLSRNNDPGVCGKTVNYDPPVVSDNCPNLTTTCNPVSGFFFPVGRTTVTCTATDNVGLSSTCTFNVVVRDLESPSIDCPDNVTISCETSRDPSNTGMPVSLDNCGINPETFSDLAAGGGCPQDSILTRTWTVTDIHGNTSTCNQTIEVIDRKSPMLTCPRDIEVPCDTTTAATGMATVKDDCDPNPSLTRSDAVVNGDCEWLCVIKRTWLSGDDCGNTASCVQTITKNTLPLIEQALNKDLNGDGKADTLVLGVSNSTVAIPPGRGACIIGWLPSPSLTPSGLKFKNAVVGADCLPGLNPLDRSGKIENALFAEALKLNIVVRVKPTVGTTKLSTLGCPIAPIVLQALAPNPDVNELIRVTNAALGNIALQPHLNELLDALRCINGPLDVCD